ncbi:molybdenum ABC transporter ATP-binding protein [Lactobacillus sp. HT06-2]|uniref:molybdenum ABC transporter ATP-binding protein n=1 Tax=Lactobacillus sp. HT06-2 TaxID=2080222 RepID=UPI000CD80CBA|nr:molybdenum ABC transporter ATP-binding protein [Lactobacillus sp. HT06-2]
MNPAKLKKLLHERHKETSNNDSSDANLKIKYVSATDAKNNNLSTECNTLRRKIIDKDLNKYIHPDSVHIRLKPYNDAHQYVTWIGLFSDLTLPNQKNLNGSILLDKISVLDESGPIILDYHAWLNVENIKYLNSKTQKLAIGDYLVGVSRVKQYGLNKYGLDSTVILRAGMFVGSDKVDSIISGYDRKDDWVLELKNTDLLENNYRENYQENRETFFDAPGHVEASFQPSRYEKFQERLATLNRPSSDDVLPLVDPQLKPYEGGVISSHAVEVKTVGHKMPQLEVNNVHTKDGRLVFAKYFIPYITELKSLGELQRGDIISFNSSASHYNSGLFDKFFNFKLETKHDFIPLPYQPNQFLGYIMWRHPEEGSESNYIASYQNWALAQHIHEDKIRDELADLRPTKPLSVQELADSLNVSKDLINEADRQGVISPIEGTGLVKRYERGTWETLRKILGAQDMQTIQSLKRFLPVCTVDDIVEETDATRTEVESRIQQDGYLPLNGQHYNVNLYGRKIMKLFRSKTTAQALLPKKSMIRTKVEIPRDLRLPVPEDELENDPKLQEKANSKLSAKEILLKQRAAAKSVPLKQEEADAESKENVEAPVEKVQVKKIEHVRDVDVDPAEKAENDKSDNVETDSSVENVTKSNEDKEISVNSTDKFVLLLETFAGEHFECEQFATFDEAKKFILESSSKVYINKFVMAKNLDTGKVEGVSTKNISRFGQK